VDIERVCQTKTTSVWDVSNESLECPEKNIYKTLQSLPIRDRLGGRKNVLQRIAGRKMKYFGHVERMPDYRFPYLLLHERVHGQRSRGRPRKRWLNNVREDCERFWANTDPSCERSPP